MSSLSNSTTTTDSGLNPDDNHGPVVTAVTAWLLAFSTLFVALRCVSRVTIVRKWMWDDTLIVIAWILSLAFSTAILVAVGYGFGRHDGFIPADNVLPLRKLEYSFSVLYNPVLVATKVSILVFYLTLAKSNKIFRYGCWATIAIVVGGGLALTLANIAQCNPVWAEFVQPVPEWAYCTDIITLYLSSAPLNISTDLAILALPLPILTKMRLPRKQKIILVITFSFGAFVAAVDVVRIAYLEDAFQVRFEGTTQQRVSIEDDFSWSASLSFMWSAVEVHVGIICACVPSLKPLVARILPSMLRDTTDPHDVSVNLMSAEPISQLDAPNTRRQTQRDPYELHEPDLEIPKLEDDSSVPVSRDFSSDQPVQGSHEMDFMEFLTTPETPAPIQRTQTARTAATRRTTATNFDFYTMAPSTTMTKYTNKQSFLPLMWVTTLFFLWGCAYGFLNVLNSQFAAVAKFSSDQSVGTHAAYFGGYAIGPWIPGRWVLKNGGFKATFITGLCIYAVGTLVFWPAAVLLSFPAYVISNVMVGIGVSVLEVGANPFIALCGPSAYSEARLNISQGFQAIGTVLAPLLAQKVLFKGVSDPVALIDVQWTYLGISLFAIALAVIFFYLQIPEASDDDFEEVAERRSSANSATILGGRIKIVHLTLALGVLSQFCYVGVQEAVSVIYTNYISSVSPNDSLDPQAWQTIGHTVFAIGRFLTAALQLLIKPRRILLFLFVGMIITSALCLSLTGRAAITALTFYELFQSGVFPLIFAISLRGLGAHTKTGAVCLTAAICGGAVVPVIEDSVIDARGQRYAFSVVIAIAAIGAVFPIYLETVPKAKQQVDPIYPRKPILPPQETVDERRPTSQSGFSEKFKARFRRVRDEEARPEAEHIKQRSV